MPWSEAGVQAGYRRTDDLNGYQQEGFGPNGSNLSPPKVDAQAQHVAI